MVPKSDVENIIKRMRNGEMNVEEDINRLFGDDKDLEHMFRWDSISGDCSTSHFTFKERLEHDSRWTMVKWKILVGGEHAMMTGTMADGSTLLVDVGTSRECVAFGGLGVHEYAPLLGKINSTTVSRAVFRLEKQSGVAAQVFMRVHTICCLN
jgi:hypothetical protein